MEVLLRNDCGTLQAKLTKPDFVKPVRAVLLSDNSIVGPLVIGENGVDGFTFANLAPGTYKLYAFDSLDGLEYANPDAMKSFSATEVTVGPKQTITVTVDVISRTGT